jgi:formylglycine-generating enzyme required for sulfatase activity/cytochrome oxidase Cu insertion factor (SCO1/SenC/PrrC family)
VTRARRSGLLVAGVVLCAAASAYAAGTSAVTVAGLPLARIPAGRYTPLYRAQPASGAIDVPAFWLMTRPVTNAEFLAFVAAHPAYRRGRVAAAFADAAYLSHWRGPTALGAAARAQQPVTRVSWFAAKAFCESHGLRLPTEAEWELAAAPVDAEQRARILRWYETPDAELPDVPHAAANAYGVHDLHAVIWEWVADFAATALAGQDPARGEVCGASGSNTSGDNTDYPAFMRAALRSSLKANYTFGSLGFRCAADASAGGALAAEARAPLGEPATGTIYDLGLTLTDQRGARVELAALRGHPLVVAMFYASCTSVCPMLIEQIKHVDASLDPAVRAQARVVLVSLDPEHDTVERLRELAALHRIDDARWYVARAPDAGVRSLAALLGIGYQPVGGGQYSHTPNITLVDRSGAIARQVMGSAGDLSGLSRTLATLAEAAPSE